MPIITDSAVVTLFPMVSNRCALVGMVHVPALPGSPGWAGSMQNVRKQALRDAKALLEGGCDALLVENMGDLPYLRGAVGPETVAAMAVVTAEIAALGGPIGVQVLAGANLEALSVAVAAGAHFIRVESYAYAHVADEGWIDASAGPLMRLRRALGAEVAIWADVQKKHAAHSVTSDLSLTALAEGFAFCGADVLIVTGEATGKEVAPEDVEAVRKAGLPVVAGSGVRLSNVGLLRKRCAAVIVGSSLKFANDWRKPVDVARVKALREAIEAP